MLILLARRCVLARRREMNRPRLQIVRGLPGSGKSTYARQHWPHLLMYEFDFFCMRGGEYAFGDSRNAEGQRWLSEVISQALSVGIDLVVAGVFAGKTENLDGLVDEAQSKGYEVWIETMVGDHGNAHGVRKADYDLMASDFVSDAELYSRLNKRVHFGSMPERFVIAPMSDGL